MLTSGRHEFRGISRAVRCGHVPLAVLRQSAAARTQERQGPGLLPRRRFNTRAITPCWNEDSLKFTFRSRAALPENYCNTADIRPGDFAPVSPAKLKARTPLGASLVANHLHRVCFEVGGVVAMLEREFAARAFANAIDVLNHQRELARHTDLRPERAAIEHAIGARERWIRERRVPS